MEDENEQIEKLAEYSHSAWSGWMKYQFSKCIKNDDSSVTIPKESVERWTRQMNTQYKDLPEKEKESDKKEAREILSLLKES